MERLPLKPNLQSLLSVYMVLSLDMALTVGTLYGEPLPQLLLAVDALLLSNTGSALGRAGGQDMSILPEPALEHATSLAPVFEGAATTATIRPATIIIIISPLVARTTIARHELREGCMCGGMIKVYAASGHFFAYSLCEPTKFQSRKVLINVEVGRIVVFVSQHPGYSAYLACFG